MAETINDKKCTYTYVHVHVICMYKIVIQTPLSLIVRFCNTHTVPAVRMDRQRELLTLEQIISPASLSVPVCVCVGGGRETIQHSHSQQT